MAVQRTGLEPYRELAKIISFPEVFQYYIIIALVLEIFVAVGVWIKPLFKVSILLIIGLTISGIALSIYSLVFKLNSDCGCGLFGEDETIIFIQKLIIFSVMAILFGGREQLFSSRKEI